MRRREDAVSMSTGLFNAGIYIVSTAPTGVVLKHSFSRALAVVRSVSSGWPRKITWLTAVSLLRQPSKAL